MVDLIFEAGCSTLHSRHPLGWRSVNLSINGGTAVLTLA